MGHVTKASVAILVVAKPGRDPGDPPEPTMATTEIGIVIATKQGHVDCCNCSSSGSFGDILRPLEPALLALLD